MSVDAGRFPTLRKTRKLLKTRPIADGGRNALGVACSAAATLMTSLSISASGAPAPHPSQAGATPTPNGTKPFSTFLQRSDSEYDQPVKSVKALPKQEKDAKPEKDRTAQAAALALLLPAQQPHLPLDTRGLSLALPKKDSETAKASAAAAGPEGTEQAAAPVPGAASTIASKQKLAFGATIAASLDKVGSPAEQQNQPAKAALVDDKPNSGKQQHSGSSDLHHGASSQDAAPPNVVTAKSEASSPAHFSVPATPTSAPATLVQPAYSAAPAAKISQPTPVVHTTVLTETVETPVARPQNIEIQTGDVNVRVSERGGEVQITVRTTDNDMAQSLRQHLPELSDKLTQTGVHADLWQPAAPQSAAFDQGAGSAPGRDGQNQQQSGTPDGQPGNQQSREQQEQSHDDWRQEFSSAEADDR